MRSAPRPDTPTLCLCEAHDEFRFRHESARLSNQDSATIQELSRLQRRREAKGTNSAEKTEEQHKELAKIKVALFPPVRQKEARQCAKLACAGFFFLLPTHFGITFSSSAQTLRHSRRSDGRAFGYIVA